MPVNSRRAGAILAACGTLGYAITQEFAPAVGWIPVGIALLGWTLWLFANRKRRRKIYEPTKEELDRAPRLLAYDIQQFDNCLRSWGLNPTHLKSADEWATITDFDRFWKNIRLEATLVHARIVMECFRSPKKRPQKDVLAADIGFPPGLIPNAKNLTERINKYLAHVTYDRLEGLRDQQKKIWRIEWFRPLVVRCAELLRHDEVNRFVSEHAPPEDKTLWRDVGQRIEETKKYFDEHVS